MLGDDSYSRVSTAPTDTGYTAVAAGFTHTCALDDFGRIHCWGSVGGTDPELSSIPSDTGYRAIAVSSYTTCAVAADYTIECWGSRKVDFMDAFGDNHYTDISLGTTVACARDTHGGHVCYSAVDPVLNYDRLPNELLAC